MGEKIPEAWLNLEKKLIKLREEQNKDFLLFKQLEAISAGVGIFDKNEVRTKCCQKDHWDFGIFHTVRLSVLHRLINQGTFSTL